MHQRTDLATGLINGHDRVNVELIQPPDSPPIVAINWPVKPTVSTVDRFPAVAAEVARLFASAATALAPWKAHGQ
jgi:hypothetical protein